MQLRSEDVAWLLWSLGCSLGIPIWVALRISLLDLALSFRSSIPGRRSVCCVWSKVAFLCAAIRSTTGLTGWEDRSRSSVFLIIYIVRLGTVWIFIVGVWVCFGTTIVIVGTIRIISGLVFFSFELTALILIVTCFCFLQWWHVGLGFSEFCCGACCIAVFIGISSRASKPFSSNSFSRCDTICSNVPFSKCAWLIVFFRWGGILHRWIARWSLERQLRMRLSPISGVHLENQIISGLRDWRPVVEIYVLL